MRFAATLTASGLVGLLLIEALKILLAPAALWLLGVVMLAVKVTLFVGGAILILVLSVWLYKRMTRDPDEIVV